MVIINGWRLKYLKAKKKPTKKHSCYVRRNENVSELGYAGYKEYLKSEDWKQLREKKLRRYPDCLVCNNPSSQVHHMSYTPGVLLGLEDWRLVTLCDACHQKIEFDDAGNKTRLCDANKRLRALAREAGKSEWLVLTDPRTRERKKAALDRKQARKDKKRQRKREQH